MNSKGQIFIVLAIIAAVTIVLIRISIGTPSLIEQQKSLEASLEESEFNNFKDELVFTAILSANQSKNITNNTLLFFDFGKSVFKNKARDLTGVFIGSVYANATTNTDVRMNVTAANFLNLKIDTLILNFTGNGVEQTFNDIEPGQNIDTNFTFNTNANANYTLWTHYKTSSDSITQNITIFAELGKSNFVGYYDLRLSGSRGEFNDRFTKTIPLLQ